MARISPVTRDAVRQNERAAYDTFSAKRGSEPKIGPYSIIAHMPEMAQRLEALRTYIRNEASLAQKLQELVMLTVAREMNCGFIWYAHAAVARQAGVRNDVVDNIRENRALANLARDEEITIKFPREFCEIARSTGPPSMPPPP